MTLTEFYLILTLGVVSSMHCVQMCGPLVLAYSLPLSAPTKRRLAVAHLAYNCGRITTYAALGAVAGFLGATLGGLGRLGGVENIAALIAGGAMVLAGLFMLDLLPAKALQSIDVLRFTSYWLKPIGGRIASPSVKSKFGLGLLMGFLPCGLIYAALLKAIATGAPLAGALTMVAFGLGTAGSLLAIGLLSTAFSFQLGRWGSRLAAVSVALMGAVLVWRGVMPMLPWSATNPAPHCH